MYQDKKLNPYENYLLSPEWKRKAEWRKAFDGVCQMCGGPAEDVHHLTYHNIFHEDPEKDLVSLCHRCHLSVHTMMNRKTDARTGRHGWRDTISAYVRHIK